MALNDITGDSIVTSPSNELYREGYDRIFRPKSHNQEEILEENTEKPAKESGINEI